MYFWIILASFVVGLAGYNMPVRDDYQAVTNVKYAEGVASQLVTQHAAALKYVSDNTPPNNAQPTISYTHEDITQYLVNYLPSEFKDRNPDPAVFDLMFVSEIFCFDETNTTKPQIACADDGSTLNILVTYGPPPSHLYMSDGTVSYDLIKAIGRLTSASVSVGATETVAPVGPPITNFSDSTMVIRSKLGKRVYLPPGVTTAEGGPIGSNELAYITVLEQTSTGVLAPP